MSRIKPGDVFAASLYDTVKNHFPQPIARAMYRFKNAKFDKRVRLAELGEITLQTVVIYLLANHVTLDLELEEESAVTESMAQFITGDSAGKWTLLLKELIKVVESKEAQLEEIQSENTQLKSPCFFFDTLSTWWTKQTIQTVDHFVEWRNDLHHRKPTELSEGVALVSTLLHTFNWLTKYVVLSFGDAQKTRTGRDGEVYVYKGEKRELIRSSWTADPFDRLYIAHKDRGILMIDPFMTTHEHIELPKDYPNIHSQEAYKYPLFSWRFLKEEENTEKNRMKFQMSGWVTGGEQKVFMPQTPPWQTDETRTNQQTLREWASHIVPRYGEIIENQFGDEVSHLLDFVPTESYPRLPKDFQYEGLINDQGGSCEILRARSKEDQVAVKVLKQGHSHRARRRLDNEAWIFTHLSKTMSTHKGRLYVIQAKRRENELGEPCLVMDECRQNLRNRLKQKPPLEITLLLGYRIALGIDYLHDKDIIHRDLKPENIVISPSRNDDPLIIDLGSALLISQHRLTSEGECVGTPGYEAPETKSGFYTFKSDVYSFGKILEDLHQSSKINKPQERQVEKELLLLIEQLKHRNDEKRLSMAEVVIWFEKYCHTLFYGQASPPPRKDKTLSTFHQLGHALCYKLNTQRELESSDLLESIEYEHSQLSKINREWKTLRRWHLNSTWFHYYAHLTLKELYSLKRSRVTPEASCSWLVSLEISPKLSAQIKGKNIGLQRVLTLQTKSALRSRTLNWLTLYEILFEYLGTAEEKNLDPLNQSYPDFDELLERIPQPWYTHQVIRKPNGGSRRVLNPNATLKNIQRALFPLMESSFKRQKGNQYAMAFLEGRNVALAAKIHAGAKKAVVVDIENFFGSITDQKVPWHLVLSGSIDSKKLKKTAKIREFEHLRNQLIQSYIAKYPTLEDQVIFSELLLPTYATQILTKIVMYGDKGRLELPQGAPTSPILANFAALSLDKKISNACLVRSWTYTRYADDLVISTSRYSKSFHKIALKLSQEVIKDEGWTISSKKTKTQTAGNGAGVVICGIKVPPKSDHSLALSRSQAQKVRSALYRIKSRKFSTPEEYNYTKGMLGYAYQVSGHHKYAALTPGRVCDKVIQLAQLIVGDDQLQAFIEGWTDQK